MLNITSKINSPAIIFDFGGVLVDWNPRYLYRKLMPGDEPGMERFLVETDFAGWNHRMDAGWPFSEGVADLCTRFPHYCRLIRAYDDRFLETLGGPIPGTVEILHRLYTAGLPLYGLSNWSAEKFRLVRQRYEFFNWLQDMVISGEVGMAKPDPRIFKAALAMIDRPAGECLFIDDMPANIETARSLGFHAIRFENPAQLERELVGQGLLSARLG